MKFGQLELKCIDEAPDLVPEVVVDCVAAMGESADDAIWVTEEIDPNLADTAAFCEHYGVGLDESANCVVVAARRGERTWYAAVVVLASTRIDVNGLVRRELDARRVSFAPMEVAVTLTRMEYGGITPVGLPADFLILIDEAVTTSDRLVIGSGLRTSKLVVTGKFLAQLPNARVLTQVGR